METLELHRGRLIDHIQLVVRDMAASRRFYQAVFDTIGIPIAGEGDDYFWADELFISSASSTACSYCAATPSASALLARRRARTVPKSNAAQLSDGVSDQA
ncbi:VOC family protein, partial [Klebsiella pneumoniae]|uniref:VOC family protein n=1 Tax=Klebsiella pneumoniae TaxID=573 RepID=UPI0037BFAC9F